MPESLKKSSESSDFMYSSIFMLGVHELNSQEVVKLVSIYLRLQGTHNLHKIPSIRPTSGEIMISYVLQHDFKLSQQITPREILFQNNSLFTKKQYFAQNLFNIIRSEIFLIKYKLFKIIIITVCR